MMNDWAISLGRGQLTTGGALWLAMQAWWRWLLIRGTLCQYMRRDIRERKKGKSEEREEGGIIARDERKRQEIKIQASVPYSSFAFYWHSACFSAVRATRHADDDVAFQASYVGVSRVNVRPSRGDDPFT